MLLNQTTLNETKWTWFLKLIQSKKINDYIYRREYVKKKKINHGYSSYDTYRNTLCKIGVLEKVKPGIYIKRKNIKTTWSYSQIKEIAYGDTWKSWFIKFD